MSTLSPNDTIIIVLLMLSALFSGLAAGLLINKLSQQRKLKNHKTSNGSSGSNGSKPGKGSGGDSQRLHTVYNLIVSLAASLNYKRVLDEVLNLSASLLSAPEPSSERLISVVLLFSRDRGQEATLTVGSARRLTPSDNRIVLPGQAGMLKKLLDSPQAVLADNIDNDPELGRVIAFRSCKSVIGLPLRSGLETYGVLLFAHPDANYFTQERRELLEIISHQASIAIHNAQLYKDLEDEKNRMIEIQEEARKKLARDLHDGPTQSVSAIAMRVNFARRLMERDPKAGFEELAKVEDMARRTTKEIRHMLFTLRPLVLESQGLIAALTTMSEKMRETYDQKVTIRADPFLVNCIESNKQAVLFTIAEEAVNNARKHAMADEITVSIKPVENDLAVMEVEDNGAGFNVKEVDALYEKRGSMGLVNMRERADLVNGILKINSAEGSGTCISLLFPMNEEAADRLRRAV